MLKSAVKKCLLSATLLATVLPAQAAIIDLNNWVQEGLSTSGNWNVATDGSSVLQTINGQPTYFVSPDSFINSEFTGSFSVSNDGDDDYIGFVFGFNGLDDYYLFDWKRGDQVFGGEQAFAGFTLSHISSETDVNFWDHSGSGISVLDSDYSPSLGWEYSTEYQFTLGYTATEINIAIDGGTFNNQQIFSLSGLNNAAGRFGFYNYSQSQVQYVGFEEDVCTVNCGNVSVPAPAPLGLLAAALIGVFVRSGRRY
ncbi:hypothetical protein [Alteromonas halophila]|uniref:TSP C-terminal domain-containing protein n=1 Tax=Alteromonas halophila TaxID=516698 RepID=A0A918JMS4_9ALTE|nr:hypothetical protein [Alteromonas halophila]GGW86554.1 hypothetical protein GCM10007391_20320 [Alteromonas halophila]